MKTIYVGMSGGVDSSVSAALLQQQGYWVVGIYMQNWTQSVAGVNCPWREDLADAKSVAAALDIPFKVFDFQAQYKQKVVDYMVAEYQSGRTPNPDIMCNQEIKFKLFLDTALADGADLIATGHYAKIAQGQKPKDQRYELHTGKDPAKDQSYFLYRVTEDALSRSLMPVGEFTKPAIRELATQFKLPTADKPDSQGICFVGEVGIKDFLRQYVKVTPGKLLDKKGIELGEHEGAIFYTIGQRHGLGVGGGKPFYVISKNMAANTVTVTDNPDDLAMHSSVFFISDTHWINDKPKPGIYTVRTRYRAPLIGCNIEPSDSGYSISMERPDRAVTPGQSAVLYDDDRVVGGGIIQ